MRAMTLLTALIITALAGSNALADKADVLQVQVRASGGSYGFDVVSHFDIVKRYGHAHYGDYQPERFRETVQPVLDQMAVRGIGIEINASGVFGPGTPYPERSILEWARHAGVPALTIGTDSHEPRVFAHGLADGIRLARESGWTEEPGR